MKLVCVVLAFLQAPGVWSLERNDRSFHIQVGTLGGGQYSLHRTKLKSLNDGRFVEKQDHFDAQ